MTVLAQYTVGKKRDVNSLRLSISGEPFRHIGVSGGDRIKTLDSGDSVLIVPSTHPAVATVLADYGVYDTGDNLTTTLFTPALEPLGVSPGDSVLVRDSPVGLQLVRGDAQ